MASRKIAAKAAPKVSAPAKPKATKKPPAQVAGFSTATFTQEIAQPALFGVRLPYNDFNTAFLDPLKLANILNGAAMLSTPWDYAKMAEVMEEKDLTYRNLIGQRKMAVTSLPLISEAFDGTPQSQAVADAVGEMLQSDCVQGALINIADAVSKGMSANEIVWDTTGSTWVPSEIIYRPMFHFEYSRDDGRTIFLRPMQFGQPPILLQPGKWIVHQPVLKSGSSIRSGLAFIACWAWLLKSMAEKDWVIYCEVFGQPIRTGKYKKGTREQDIAVLRKAVQSIGTDMAAVFEEGMEIEFISAAKGGAGGPALYKEFCEYLNAQLSKLILGQTLTSGDGDGKGSYSLGKVHKHVLDTIVKSDARELAATIRRDLVEPFVRLNFGADTPLPNVYFQLIESTDLVGLATALEKLTNAGLEVGQDWVREQYGIPHPDEGDKLLAPITAMGLPAALKTPVDGEGAEAGDQPKTTKGDDDATPAKPKNPAKKGEIDEDGAVAHGRSGCPVHSHSLAHLAEDKIDGLVSSLFGEWEQTSKPLRDYLTDAVANCTTAEDMAHKLKTAIHRMPQSLYASVIKQTAVARAKVRLAGQSGAEV